MVHFSEPRLRRSLRLPYVFGGFVLSVFLPRQTAARVQSSEQHQPQSCTSVFGVSVLLTGRRFQQVLESQFLQRLFGHELTGKTQGNDKGIYKSVEVSRINKQHLLTGPSCISGSLSTAVGTWSYHSGFLSGTS